uniref:Uncharacterized protein n=1 Tax=Triticum urartu TaxID=4572 RepID=A0A8R7VH02_TRIUA
MPLKLAPRPGPVQRQVQKGIRAGAMDTGGFDPRRILEAISGELCRGHAPAQWRDGGEGPMGGGGRRRALARSTQDHARGHEYSFETNAVFFSLVNLRRSVASGFSVFFAFISDDKNGRLSGCGTPSRVFFLVFRGWEGGGK